MSMLTEQAKKLRETAAELCQYGTHFGYSVTRDPLMRDAARQMVNAADTIENLRNRLTDMCELEINTDMTAIKCSRCGYVVPKGTDLMSVHYCAGCGRKVIA